MKKEFKPFEKVYLERIKTVEPDLIYPPIKKLLTVSNMHPTQPTHVLIAEYPVNKKGVLQYFLAENFITQKEFELKKEVEFKAGDRVKIFASKNYLLSLFVKDPLFNTSNVNELLTEEFIITSVIADRQKVIIASSFGFVPLPFTYIVKVEKSKEGKSLVDFFVETLFKVSVDVVADIIKNQKPKVEKDDRTGKDFRVDKVISIVKQSSVIDLIIKGEKRINYITLQQQTNCNNIIVVEKESIQDLIDKLTDIKKSI